MSVDFAILWCPTDGPTSFPCVDCGLLTGNFCDGSRSVGYDRCFAGDRVPKDYANASGFGNQRTPLCSYCETLSNYCRFCRAIPSCTPFTRHDHWSGIPLSESRRFDETRRGLALAQEFATRKAVSEEKTKQAAQSVGQHQVNEVDGRMNSQEGGVIQQYETGAEGHSKSVEGVHQAQPWSLIPSLRKQMVSVLTHIRGK